MDVVVFFQAEGGIRAGHVTGVQTCALPIWSRAPPNRPMNSRVTKAGNTQVVITVAGWWRQERTMRPVRMRVEPIRPGEVGRAVRGVAVVMARPPSWRSGSR